MGFVIAIICGLLFVPIYQSKMTKGQLSVTKTFWLFGIFVVGILVAISAVYVEYKMGMDPGKGGVTLGAFKTVLIPVGFYSFCVFLGIWRSAKQLQTLKKIIVRYFSTFFLSITLSAVIYSWMYSLLLIFIVYLILKSKKTSIENKTENCA
ncbi:hypothetical protein [Aliivibrio fischeri]|uniref:hypothetical protein n=1 Tax=Aliivibrio fischeri TaxID=668 RepID=UPI0007C51CA3|nr:hypothetical protein [Aliivibrio fischeri]